MRDRTRGNDKMATKKIPVMRYSRKLAEGGKGWNAAVARARRNGPGGVGVGTFMSPCSGVRIDSDEV